MIYFIKIKIDIGETIIQNEKIKEFDRQIKFERLRLIEKKKKTKIRAQRKLIEKQIREFDRNNRRQRFKLLEEQKKKDAEKKKSEQKLFKSKEKKEVSTRI
eukprot:gene11727-5066_t